MIRSQLGPYRILDKLGEGGMGEVYRARHGKLDRDIAIKVLPAALSSDRERIERFEQEAKAVNKVYGTTANPYDRTKSAGLGLTKGETAWQATARYGPNP